MWYFAGSQYGGEFFAGWLTEYSLSIDNLFIFIVIMGKLAVPRELQQSALMVGIVLALVLRGIFIAVGAAAIAQFSWVFYIFGLFLVMTAVNLWREAGDEEGGYDEPRLVRFARRHLPFTETWNGAKLTVRENGSRLFTPMFLVILTLGMTDLLFALDSIPAIYGLTNEPYLVLTANIFALMGLRQLYFLIGDLLKRLVYLSYGLAFLLLFIGVKLILHAMHENTLPFINGGEPDPVGTGHPDLGLAAGHRRHSRRHDGPQPRRGPTAYGGLTSSHLWGDPDVLPGGHAERVVIEVALDLRPVRLSDAAVVRREQREVLRGDLLVEGVPGGRLLVQRHLLDRVHLVVHGLVAEGRVVGAEGVGLVRVGRAETVGSQVDPDGQSEHQPVERTLMSSSVLSAPRRRSAVEVGTGVALKPASVSPLTTASFTLTLTVSSLRNRNLIS